jgi:hypothetical protein
MARLGRAERKGMAMGATHDIHIWITADHKVKVRPYSAKLPPGEQVIWTCEHEFYVTFPNESAFVSEHLVIHGSQSSNPEETGQRKDRYAYEVTVICPNRGGEIGPIHLNTPDIIVE